MMLAGIVRQDPQRNGLIRVGDSSELYAESKLLFSDVNRNRGFPTVEQAVSLVFAAIDLVSI